MTEPAEELTELRKRCDKYRMVLFDVHEFLERICSPGNKVLLKVKKALGYVK